jgi:hypothetical protein
MRDSLGQQIGRLQQIPLRAPCKGRSQKKVFGAAIKIEGGEISGWWAFNCQLLSGRDFGVKLLCDPLGDLALDSEHVFQIAIVFFCPGMRIGVGVDQLNVYVKPGPGLPYAAF